MTTLEISLFYSELEEEKILSSDDGRIWFFFFFDQIFWFYNDSGDNDFTIFNAKNCSVPYISRWTRSVNNRVVAFPHGRYIRSAVESESETETEEETTTTTVPTTTMAENTEKPLQDPPPSNIQHHKRPPRVHIHNIRLV